MRFEEKRQYRRARYAEPLECQFPDPSRYGGALSCDLSAGGLRMKYHDFIPLGTELTVNVPTESNKIVECQGKVMWASKMPLTDWYEIGLKFTEDGSGVMTRKKI
ncbi:MAG: PilZ domain-containing protein, partial [Candidatus Omnitrophica bacterium]|nr:PilZ domain-containing protein [Candidatus Omnitrophota bacterium]